LAHGRTYRPGASPQRHEQSELVAGKQIQAPVGRLGDTGSPLRDRIRTGRHEIDRMAPVLV
jgi:hypothetical protein